MLKTLDKKQDFNEIEQYKNLTFALVYNLKTNKIYIGTNSHNIIFKDLREQQKEDIDTDNIHLRAYIIKDDIFIRAIKEDKIENYNLQYCLIEKLERLGVNLKKYKIHFNDIDKDFIFELTGLKR